MSRLLRLHRLNSALNTIAEERQRAAHTLRMIRASGIIRGRIGVSLPWGERDRLFVALARDASHVAKGERLRRLLDIIHHRLYSRIERETFI